MFNTDMFAWLSNPDNLDPGNGSGHATGSGGGYTGGRADGLSATDGTMFPWLDVGLVSSPPSGCFEVPRAHLIGHRVLAGDATLVWVYVGKCGWLVMSREGRYI